MTTTPAGPLFADPKRLLLDMAQEHALPELLRLIVDRLADSPRVALARIWLAQPTDGLHRLPDGGRVPGPVRVPAPGRQRRTVGRRPAASSGPGSTGRSAASRSACGRSARSRPPASRSRCPTCAEPFPTGSPGRTGCGRKGSPGSRASRSSTAGRCSACWPCSPAGPSAPSAWAGCG